MYLHVTVQRLIGAFFYLLIGILGLDQTALRTLLSKICLFQVQMTEGQAQLYS
jgi:hypothetical protein